MRSRNIHVIQKGTHHNRKQNGWFQLTSRDDIVSEMENPRADHLWFKFSLN